ncbi:MAG: PorT family protein [Bacteroidetes bacterium]|nr:PorT family protein [Bacteroidota bacterium]
MQHRYLSWLGTLLLLCPLGSYAQKGLHLGIRIMPQYTQLRNADDASAPETAHSYQTTWGMTAGFSSMYALDNYWSFGTNLLYSSQGHTYTHSYDTGLGSMATATNEQRLRYVKMPFLVKWNTDATQKLAFMVEGGLQPGLLISAEETRRNLRIEPAGPPYVTYNQYPDRKDTYQAFQLWGVLGAGAEVKLRYNVKLNLSLRAEYGFLDAEDKSATYRRTVLGETTTQPFYSPRPDRPSFTDNRPSSHWLTAGLNIGITYVFIPHFRP